ncbi:beta and beta-prime subunits of DNA dependent RNA-polymerase [Pseudovirgaria hyperparasitica]|uniref:DNA-directed RNA polymerase subunit n=1 Tax=Pseudovirgaria hyperparasitica TaxID=470096 RepID=A0A6A6VVP0_9PEZI|nr:beta and beta-prime subunits of DNA dependent RNA-polymerase [Pseudovirgaria hyperparasitica]KAF2753317.1 beta and beta-prime subunits of DNA dependent RNA-polymerase [Pseudovirgaria hyperparasitica]
MREEGMKGQVVDHVPKRITELRFGILSNKEIVDQSVVEVSDRNVYDLATGAQARKTTDHGPLDSRMGISSKTAVCSTCNEELAACNGHFGYVRLALPAFHIGYFRNTIEVLHSICKECSAILLEEHQRRTFLKSLRRPNLDNLQKTQICKKVSTECRKVKECYKCGAVNGFVRKVPGHPLKIVHFKYEAFNKSTAKSKTKPRTMVDFEESFKNAKEGNTEIEKHMRKAVDDMNPLKVLNLFRRIITPDCELLGLDPNDGRPEMFIWQYVPAPPVSIRPSVSQEAATTEDDITNKLGDIIQVSSYIRAGLEKGQPVQTIMEQWDFLQLQIAMYINADVPGLQQHGFSKSMRGFCQRLKGKGGRFRQNLSGKRVDFSGRTVIGPDPNLSIEEVAVPDRVAKNLTYPEKCSIYNKEKLQKCIERGPYKHPGANYIKKLNGRTVMLSILAKFNNLSRAAAELEIGDVVERHLEDGDIVLFNRQPSLHKLSILSHRAKIRPWRTFRLNECVCNPYNADFDGDEMNLHVPQTEEARAEAIELMGVKHNLATPKNGTPIIAAIQDFITGAYLLSQKDNLYDRGTFTQICGYMFNGDSVLDPDTGKRVPIDIPPPAILKPQRLWTGKQVFNVLMRPSRSMNVLVNLEAKCKQYKPDPAASRPDLVYDDSYLVIRNSVIMSGMMDKATVGDGKKDSVFSVIMRDFGPNHAVQSMNRLAKLSARWLTNQGFSIGISDVTPGTVLKSGKQKLVLEAYAKCDELIQMFKNGTLERDAGCDQEQTMENKIGGILSGVRQSAGEICFQELSRWNSALIMAKSGSKGSNINVSQMVASVGQQMINNKRVADGFQDRTLPHFPKAARQPGSKGFVSNSFFSGLTPTEFIFHAMSGREGLVDTAVKTAETGYMSRRLMKSLEDLSAQYDGTVRNGSSSIIQFKYGDDNLDPVDMEGNAKPVNFERTYTHAITTTWDAEERSIPPEQIGYEVERLLRKRRSLLQRVPLLAKPSSTAPAAQVQEPEPPKKQAKGKRKTKKQLAEEEEAARVLRNIQQTSTHRSLLDLSEEEQRALSAKDFLDMLGYNDKSDAGIDHLDSERDFLDTVERFVKEKAEALIQLKRANPRKASAIGGLSYTSLNRFMELCLEKFERSKVQPGHAVGAVGAQSIGEPGTQMTLKTFHFAGVAGMSITQGVPRIKEIINASKTISTPVISCELANPESEYAARIVKGRIEKTFLRDIVRYIDDIWYGEGCYLGMAVDFETIDKLQLDVTMTTLCEAIENTKSLKLPAGTRVSGEGNKLKIEFNESNSGAVKSAKRGRAPTTKLKEGTDFYMDLQRIKRLLPDVIIQGYPLATRAIIKKGEAPRKGTTNIYDHQLLVEGYGLRACMCTPGLNGTKTKTNSVIEIKEVLGIEAARQTIIDEISAVMGNMDIDPRHMQLLADVMTSKGDVLGITRFGLAKMRDSVLQLASFEKTPDHLFEAAWRNKKDKIEGVSECIIMGQSMRIGTGAFKVVRPFNDIPEQMGRACGFEEAMRWMGESAKASGVVV